MPKPLRIPEKESEYLARRGRKSRNGVAFQSEGPEVQHLQEALLALGYSLPNHGVDSVFGVETHAAVKNFQSSHKDLFVIRDGKNPPLQKDGVVGPKTALALNCALARAGKWFKEYKYEWKDDEGVHRIVGAKRIAKTDLPKKTDLTQGEKVSVHFGSGKATIDQWFRQFVAEELPEFEEEKKAREYFDKKYKQMVSLGMGAGAIAGRVFYIPSVDGSVPVAEGPTQFTSWEGYHAWKHGVVERWDNGRNMGQTLFKGDEWRYIKEEIETPDGKKIRIKNADGTLNKIPKAWFKEAMGRSLEAMKKGTNPAGWSRFIDTVRFTTDAADWFNKVKGQSSTTTWRGRYAGSLKPDGTWNPVSNPQALQINVDYKHAGQRFRISYDARTGQLLNHLRIDEGPPIMKYSEIEVIWKGKVTGAIEEYRAPNSPQVKYQVSSTMKGLIMQGIKTGAISGAAVGGFLAAIDGFKKKGLLGALEGAAIGMAVGAASGAALGALTSWVSRISSLAGKVIKVAGFVTTVLGILLDASETGLDPDEWAKCETDKDGNTTCVRNIRREGSLLFPEYRPQGISVASKDGTIIQFGDETAAGYTTASSRVRARPISLYLSYLGYYAPPNKRPRIQWQAFKTPDDSRLYYFKTPDGVEVIITYEDGEAEEQALKRSKNEWTQLCNSLKEQLNMRSS